METKINITELVREQGAKMIEKFTIVDYVKMIIDEDENYAFCILVDDVKKNYFEFIIEEARKEVNKKLEKAFEKRVNEIKRIKELEEIEEIDDEDDDDLELIISYQIREKNIKIEQKMGKYPESQTENYWMIGIDINNLPEDELQSLSIFDRDFW